MEANMNEIFDDYGLQEPEIQPPIADKIEYHGDEAIGYFKGVAVARFGRVADINSLELYDESGKRIVPAPAPLDEMTQLQLAIAELYEEVLSRG